METLVLKAFTVIFRLVGVLLVAGTMVTVLTDIQRHAFDNKRRGLVSMLDVNEQLVGKLSGRGKKKKSPKITEELIGHKQYRNKNW